MTRNLNMNKVMIILRGLPGSGKSTFAEWLVDGNRYGGTTICCADEWMVNSGGIYQFDPKKLGFCHKKAQEQAEHCCGEGYHTVIIANTNTKRDEMKPYLDIAEKYGYTVFVLTVNNMHGSKSVHNVPDESLQKMRDRFQHFL